MQAFIQQPTPLSPKPTCFVWYAGDPCNVLIQQYNRATEQRQLVEWQLSFTAPLQKQIVEQQKQIADQQKQIADQQTQIKTLQAKIETQSLEALQSEARNQVLLDGIGAALGAGLAFFVAFAAFQRLARNATIPKREQGRAASASS